MKKATYLLLITIFFTQNLFACKCSTKLNAINQNYISADIVLQGIILKKYRNTPEDAQYYDIDINPISVYKGKKINRIKVYGINDIPYRGNSCTIDTSEKDEWIFFLKEKDRRFYLEPCTISRSKNMYKFDVIKERVELCKKVIGELKYDTKKIQIKIPYNKWTAIKYKHDSKQFVSFKMVVKKNGRLKHIKIIESELSKKTRKEIIKILKRANWLKKENLEHDAIYLFTFIADKKKLYLTDGAF